MDGSKSVSIFRTQLRNPQLIQNYEFETFLYQVRIVESCEKQSKRQAKYF